MAGDDQCAGPVVEERLERAKRVEVEVVGRLVEDQQVRLASPAPSRAGAGDARRPTASAPARTARWCRTRTVRAAPDPRSRARDAGRRRACGRSRSGRGRTSADRRTRRPPSIRASPFPRQGPTAGDDVEQRRLPRAVGADDRQPGTGLDQSGRRRGTPCARRSAGPHRRARRPGCRAGSCRRRVRGRARARRPAPDRRRRSRAALRRRALGFVDRAGAPRRSHASSLRARILRVDSSFGLALDPVGPCRRDTWRRRSTRRRRGGRSTGRRRARPPGSDRPRGEPVEGVAVVGDEHERRLHRDQPRLEPFDRLEVEVVRRLVEHDHVVVAVLVIGQHLGQRDALGLPARQLVGRTVEQRQHAERRRRGGDLPAVAAALR